MRVLILGAGGAASNGFARALRLAGNCELVGTNCSKDDLWLSECDDNHVIPHVSDYEAWRKGVFSVIRETQPSFVHAQSDPEVEALCRFRTVVHMQGAKTWLPSTETVVVCRDKWGSYKRWAEAGVPVPQTKLCSSKDAVSSIIGLGKYAKAWLRPRTGAGGQKSFVAESYKDAVFWLDRHNGWGEFTIAEMLSPASVTVQQLYWQGTLVASQQRSRESWAGAGSTTTGVSGSTGIGVTTSDPLADETAHQAVDAVDKKPHGLYGIDMTRDFDGVPRVTEINIGRFFTTAPEFFAMAGFNMADLFVRHAENAYMMNDFGFSIPPPDTVRNPIPDGYRWIRGMDHFPVLVPPE